MFFLPSSTYILLTPTPPRPLCNPQEVYIDKKMRWENILERGRGVPQDHPHLIPICALAPTVPRTLVPGVGWRRFQDEEGSVEVGGAGYDSESGSDDG